MTPCPAVRGHFSYLSAIAGLDNPTSSQITRDILGWTPTRPGLIADLASPDDVARAIAFYAGDDSAFITGTTAPVDGGLAMG
jgi:NAD(P)-dependent dehydrogenase (short-subunit alcohol dehydrogenase family)